MVGWLRLLWYAYVLDALLIGSALGGGAFAVYDFVTDRPAPLVAFDVVLLETSLLLLWLRGRFVRRG